MPETKLLVFALSLPLLLLLLLLLPLLPCVGHMYPTVQGRRGGKVWQQVLQTAQLSSR
jgi:hypothetical protein